METKSISRRDLLKSTGVLVVGFSIFGPVSKALGQAAAGSGADLEATSLDSWLAVASDGTVAVIQEPTRATIVTTQSQPVRRSGPPIA
jgi:hypothetical protein